MASSSASLVFFAPPAAAAAAAAGPPLDLPTFCADAALVVPFFRSVLARMAADGVADFRLKIRPAAGDAGGAASFTVACATGKAKAGPRSFPVCLSCAPEQARIAENNYEGGEARRGPPAGLPPALRELTSSACEWTADDSPVFAALPTALVRVWLDAQARPLLIVTPRRHAHGMGDMTDAEVAALWAAVGVCVAFEWRGGDGGAPFDEIVLNVGTFRNIEHAHVKVWLRAPDFLDRLARWPPRMRALQADLQELRRLMKLPVPSALADLLAGSTAPDGGIELVVRGRFGPGDRPELAAAFGAHGTVVRVDVADPRFAPDGAVVVLAGGETGLAAAAAACAALNLVKFGDNVMCKVKPAAAVKAVKGLPSQAPTDDDPDRS